jgi:cytochrome c biogenesis protein CcdA
MNRSLTRSEAEAIASTLDAMAAALAPGETGMAAALLAGLVASLSPCVFPVLLAYLSTLATGGAPPGPRPRPLAQWSSPPHS